MPNSYRSWWESTWSERESLLRSTFGDTHPSGAVLAFTWDDLDVMIPGGCAMTFPPDGMSRSHWLMITHGLSQPDNRDDAARIKEWNEFGFLTARPCAWCADALWAILTYVRESGSAIVAGDRMPVSFTWAGEDRVNFELGGRDKPRNPSLQSEMASLFFWPYLGLARPLTTSTGRLAILIATAISAAEWKLAKSTSTPHLLALLLAFGIGQVSDLHRTCSTRRVGFEESWRRIRGLSEAEVRKHLVALK